jgi:hypothetical protein
VENDYDAFCIDEAVAYFGNVIGSEMSHIEAKTAKQTEAKQANYLRKRLGLPPTYRRGAAAPSTAPGRKAASG